MSNSTGYNQASGSAAKISRAPLPDQTPNLNVLVVEDHEDTRFLLKTMLEMHGGISVIEAENGAAAIELAMSTHVNLILMDTDLPLVDGYTATRRIREFKSMHEVPIIILSGHAQPSAKARAFASGCTDYLVKPFALGELGKVLEQHLSQSKLV